MSNLDCYLKTKSKWVDCEVSKLNDKINYINAQYLLATTSQYSEYFADFIKNDLACNSNDISGCLNRLAKFKDMKVANITAEINFYNEL